MAPIHWLQLVGRPESDKYLVLYNETMSKMTDRRKDLRPREKLQAKGATALSDYELLMAIIGSGTAQADVTKIARICHSLAPAELIPLRSIQTVLVTQRMTELASLGFSEGENPSGECIASDDNKLDSRSSRE